MTSQNNPDSGESKIAYNFQKNFKYKCRFCNDYLGNQNIAKSVRCSHYYHERCFLAYTKKRLEQYSIQECCPVKTCLKEIVCNKIYDLLNEEETLKYNLFAILRKCRRTNLKPMWCKKCGNITIIKDKETGICSDCKNKTAFIQDIITTIKSKNPTNESNKQLFADYNKLLKNFGKQVTVCRNCTLFQQNIEGSNMILCSCNKKKPKSK